ncbi:EG45-like domain containing protein isoform X1 [Ricinus communis]|uniref:EG45-like domain containing protein isoform X1 n=1 Tax=Ricinus communis TaxID=3988 RepID=UPI0007726A8A|nr:EG45-like domain containing protein isoform X1 [Ricinus communis]|eukprot:XP_015580974.1 EG45-like domain containing protein [Ricinus communis]
MELLLGPSRLLRRQPLFTFFLISLLLSTSHGDVGTASQYSPPYLPTTCYDNDASQFPPNNLFAAAGDGIWDNGASCGREYLVRCISASVAGSCQPDQTIQVKIVDYAFSTPIPPSASGTTIILSETAFGIIANSSATSINIEFQQV